MGTQAIDINIIASLVTVLCTLIILFRHNTATSTVDAFNTLVAENKALQAVIQSQKERMEELQRENDEHRLHVHTTQLDEHVSEIL